MANSKIELTDLDIGLLAFSLRLRIASVEQRLGEMKEVEPTADKRTIDYFRDLKNQLKDVNHKLFNSQLRGLIYEGEGISEHIT